MQRPERNAGAEPPQHDTGSHPLSRTKQRRRNQHQARAAQAGKQTASAAYSARAAQSAGVAEKIKTLTACAAQGRAALIKSNAHLFVALGVLAVLLLLLLSGFSSCGVLFSGGPQVSGQVFYTAEDEDIRGAEQDYKELERKLQQKIARTPLDNRRYCCFCCCPAFPPAGCFFPAGPRYPGRCSTPLRTRTSGAQSRTTKSWNGNCSRKSPARPWTTPDTTNLRGAFFRRDPGIRAGVLHR